MFFSFLSKGYVEALTIKSTSNDVLHMGVLKIHIYINIYCICVCRCGIYYFVLRTLKMGSLQNNGPHTYIHIYNIYLYAYESLEFQWVEPPMDRTHKIYRGF